jgi:hypothetical protein
MDPEASECLVIMVAARVSVAMRKSPLMANESPHWWPAGSPHLASVVSAGS